MWHLAITLVWDVPKKVIMRCFAKNCYQKFRKVQRKSSKPKDSFLVNFQTIDLFFVEREYTDIEFWRKKLQNTIIKVFINRRFWHTLFTYNFQINKKAYLQTLKFLPIPPNISMTPIHTKKSSCQKSIHTNSFILKIKKGYLQTPNTTITFFYSNNFLKVTILIKSIHTNPKHHYNPFYTKK